MHTPGPWKMTWRHDVTAADGIVSRAPAQNARNAAMNRANCLLIATAPELLSALETLVIMVEDHATNPPGPLSRAIIAGLDAVAKAKAEPTREPKYGEKGGNNRLFNAATEAIEEEPVKLLDTLRVKEGQTCPHCGGIHYGMNYCPNPAGGM